MNYAPSMTQQLRTAATDSPVTARDRLRQVVVTVSEVLCVVGTLAGVGVIGTRVEESSGGALAADATLLAPAGPAFSIWSVVYLGLGVYTIWQWWPRAATSERTRRTGWLVAASMLLNAGWLLVTQQGWIWASVAVIAVLMLVLGLILVELARHAPASRVERVLVDGTFGLYAGWVAVATCANVTAALVDSGVSASATIGDVVAVVVLAVAVLVAALLAARVGGRLAVAAAMAWGLAWIAVGRLTDEPASAVVGIAAVVAALAVVAVTLRARRSTTASAV
jgi:hypothetical protein